MTSILKAREDKTTVEALWAVNILNPALQIVANFLSDPSAFGLQTEHESCTVWPISEPFVTPSPSAPTLTTAGPFVCAACGGRVFVVVDQWEDHLKSRSHRKRLANLRKMGLYSRAEKKGLEDAPVENVLTPL